MTWVLDAAVVFVSGCVGGSVTGLVAHARNKNNMGSSGECGGQQRGRRGFAYKEPKCETVFAGFAGNVLLGGLAAVVYWGLYGPISGFPVLGSPPGGGTQLWPFLTVGQLAGSIVLGIGGPGFLLAEAERRCCERSRNNSNNQCPKGPAVQPVAEPNVGRSEPPPVGS